MIAKNHILTKTIILAISLFIGCSGTRTTESFIYKSSNDEWTKLDSTDEYKHQIVLYRNETISIGTRDLFYEIDYPRRYGPLLFPIFNVYTDHSDMEQTAFLNITVSSNDSVELMLSQIKLYFHNHSAYSPKSIMEWSNPLDTRMINQESVSIFKGTHHLRIEFNAKFLTTDYFTIVFDNVVVKGKKNSIPNLSFVHTVNNYFVPLIAGLVPSQ
jgi:hypothetical protein